MKRAEELNDKKYVNLNTQNDETVIEENEDAKPQVASRAQDDVCASTQVAEQTSSKEAQVTALPVLHGNGAIDHNVVVQNAPGAGAMSEDTRSEDVVIEIDILLDKWGRVEEIGENKEQQFKLAREMAAQGDPIAMYQLSLMMTGEEFNTPSAQQERFSLLRAAANKGWAPALHDLMSHYQSVAGDMNAAANCFHAMQACWPACQALAEKEGWLLSEHGPLERAPTKLHTFVWQLQLARKDWPGAYLRVAAELYCMSSDRVGTKKACTWLESGVATGDPRAMLVLGMMLEHGIGTAQNRTKALALYEKAADKGLAEAQVKLASMYAQKQMSPAWRGAGLMAAGKNTSAYEWCLRALKQGSADAKLQMAQILATGDGVAKDVKAAFALCKEAADSGLQEACVPLALMYVTGTGTDPDDDGAMYYLMLPPGRYDHHGAYLLAMIHEGKSKPCLDTARRFGMQLTINKKHAFTWYREAAWDFDLSWNHDVGASFIVGNGADEKVKELVATGHGAFIDEEEAREWERYAIQVDEWKNIPRDIDMLPPEEARKLVEKSIRTGPWKPSRGEYINLSGRFGGNGNWTKYLPQALSEAPRLRLLKIKWNQLSDQSADDIAQIIRETKTLEVLDLKGSEFTETGYRTIAAAMQGNFTLRRVHVDAAYTSEESRLIRGLCVRNRNLQKLWAEFKMPSPLTFMEVPPEISELLELHLMAEDQKDGSRNASATRQRVLEMLMCLEPKVLQPRGLQTRNPQPKAPQTTADARTS